MHRIGVALIVVWLVGCSKQKAAEPTPPAPVAAEAAPPAPAPTTPAATDEPSVDSMMEQMITIMEEMANAVTAAGTDCPKMAASLDTVVTNRTADLQRIKEVGDRYQNDPEKQAEMKASADKYGPRIEALMPKMMGMAQCADDPAMKSVQAKLEAVM